MNGHDNRIRPPLSYDIIYKNNIQCLPLPINKASAPADTPYPHPCRQCQKPSGLLLKIYSHYTARLYASKNAWDCTIKVPRLSLVNILTSND